jgi:short-subunit dehydrogenase involved in D-alanine esterification of teichoic acids
MKIAITGHTDGLGQSIYNLLKTNYTTIGMSRTNGYDVSNTSQIINNVLDCDVFINNTYYKETQTELLETLFNLWKDSNKIIINLNSSCVYHSSEWAPIYAESKKKLRNKMWELVESHPNKKLRVVNIYPSTLDTHNGYNEYTKIDVNYISKTIEWLINQPAEIEIREISIYPTIQKKEYRINKLI